MQRLDILYVYTKGCHTYFFRLLSSNFLIYANDDFPFVEILAFERDTEDKFRQVLVKQLYLTFTINFIL